MLPNITVGIDVSSKTLDCTVYHRGTGRLERSSRHVNDAAGIPALLAGIPTDAALVVEPTGRYGNELIRIATDQGRTVLLAPNREAKLFLRSDNLRVKTDKVDSRGLARFGAQKVLRPYALNAPNVEQMVQLLSVRRQVTTAIASLKLQRRSLNMSKAYLDPIISDLNRHLTTIDHGIEAAGKVGELAVIPRLMAVPGLGRITASAVAARLAAKKFVSSDAFVAYCGLDVVISQSGDSKSRGSLSRHGDADLRRLFYCCAQSTLRCKNSPFKELVVRERAKGTPHTKIMCMIARKMARLCWSIHTYGTEYNPDRLFQQAPPQPASAETSARSSLS